MLPLPEADSGDFSLVTDRVDAQETDHVEGVASTPTPPHGGVLAVDFFRISDCQLLTADCQLALHGLNDHVPALRLDGIWGR